MKMKWTARVFRCTRGCPPGWKLVRAMSEGAVDPVIQAHVLGCAHCTAEADGLRALAARTRGFPEPARMSAEARQAISVRLLAARSPGARTVQWRAGLFTATAMVAAVIVIARWRTPPKIIPPQTSRALAETAMSSRASIHAIGAARFTRIQPAPNDVVRLDEGTIVLDVAPLPPGERFRVRTADAEVEVRGTHFQVSAADGKLVAVSVSRGRVEVRSCGGAAVVLQAGDDWVRGSPAIAGGSGPVVEPHAPAAGAQTRPSGTGRAAGARRTAVASSEPRTGRGTPAIAGVPIVRPAGAKQAAPPDAGRDSSTVSVQASFERAWSLLRQGDPRRAAALFAEVEARAKGGGIAEDALYWRAVALARTGEVPQACRLFDDFLSRFPGSVHHGEAATALGWLLLQSGNAGAARTAFARAIDDPSPSVRASARNGLSRASAEGSHRGGD